METMNHGMDLPKKNGTSGHACMHAIALVIYGRYGCVSGVPSLLPPHHRFPTIPTGYGDGGCAMDGIMCVDDFFGTFPISIVVGRSPIWESGFCGCRSHSGTALRTRSDTSTGSAMAGRPIGLPELAMCGIEKIQTSLVP